MYEWQVNFPYFQSFNLDIILLKKNNSLLPPLVIFTPHFAFSKKAAGLNPSPCHSEPKAKNPVWAQDKLREKSNGYNRLQKQSFRTKEEAKVYQSGLK
jgi:hypothetical protein